MKINTKNIRNKILSIAREYPEVADDDKLLIAKIWTDEGWDICNSLYQNLLKVSSPETIRRTRQKLVEEGALKPSEKATERRYEEFKQARMSI